MRGRDRGRVEAELRHHLGLMVEENEARGMDAATARAEALRRFGDVRRIREACIEEDAMSERKRDRLERN